MDIQEIRRNRLREWVAKNAVPQKEKSFFSQLQSGSISFGEKAARRLEEDYGMGELYLDGVNAAKPPVKAIPAVPPPANPDLLDGDNLIELIALFQQANTSGRDFIMTSARNASKAVAARWAKVAND